MIGSFWSTPPFTLNPNLPCSSGTMVIDTSSPLASPVDVAAVAARRAVTAFGGDAVRALSAASRWPPAGGRGELAADAEAMVAGR